MNPFHSNSKRISSHASLSLTKDDVDRNRKSSVPFGMNSPKASPSHVIGSPFRSGTAAMSPNYEALKTYSQIKGSCERSRVPFSP